MAKQELTKELVMRALRRHRGELVSPQELAREIGHYKNWNEVEMHLYQLFEDKRVIRMQPGNKYEFGAI